MTDKARCHVQSFTDTLQQHAALDYATPIITVVLKRKPIGSLMEEFKFPRENL